jgi:hypothetical protein
MNFWIVEAVCVALQLLLFIPFYCAWIQDCKNIGKDNLAVPLSERFFAWLIVFPIWLCPIVCVLKGR